MDLGIPGFLEHRGSGIQGFRKTEIPRPHGFRNTGIPRPYELMNARTSETFANNWDLGMTHRQIDQWINH